MSSLRNFKLTSALPGKSRDSWVSAEEQFVRYSFDLDLLSIKYKKRNYAFKNAQKKKKITAFKQWVYHFGQRSTFYLCTCGFLLQHINGTRAFIICLKEFFAQLHLFSRKLKDKIPGQNYAVGSNKVNAEKQQHKCRVTYWCKRKASILCECIATPAWMDLPVLIAWVNSKTVPANTNTSQLDMNTDNCLWNLLICLVLKRRMQVLLEIVCRM